MKFIKATTKGVPPAPRFGHTMVFLPSKNNLAVWGGCGSSYCPFYGDLVTFSVEKMCWFQVAVNGNFPEGRTGHGMVADGDNLIIFGGINQAGFLSSDIHSINLVDNDNKKKYNGLNG